MYWHVQKSTVHTEAVDILQHIHMRTEADDEVLVDDDNLHSCVQNSSDGRGRAQLVNWSKDQIKKY